MYVPSRNEEGDHNKKNIKKDKNKGFIAGMEMALEEIDAWKCNRVEDLKYDIEEIEENDIEKMLMKYKKRVIEEMTQDLIEWVDGEIDMHNLSILNEEFAEEYNKRYEQEQKEKEKIEMEENEVVEPEEIKEETVVEEVEPTEETAVVNDEETIEEIATEE